MMNSNKNSNLKGDNKTSEVSSKEGAWKADISSEKFDKKFDQGTERFKEKVDQDKFPSTQKKDESLKEELHDQDESTWEAVKFNVVEVKDAAFKRIEEAVEYITENVSHITHEVRQKLASLIAKAPSNVDKNEPVK